MAVDAFLKIDGIVGDHKGEVPLETFSWGVSNSGSSVCGGGGGGRTSFQDFSFTSQVGSQSVALFLHCASGRHFPKAVLTCRDANQNPIVITFSDLIISNYKEDLAFHKGQEGEDAAPLEFVSFNYAKVEVTSRGSTGSFDICQRG